MITSNTNKAKNRLAVWQNAPNFYYPKCMLFCDVASTNLNITTATTKNVRIVVLPSHSCGTLHKVLR